METGSSSLSHSSTYSVEMTPTSNWQSIVTASYSVDLDKAESSSILPSATSSADITYSTNALLYQSKTTSAYLSLETLPIITEEPIYLSNELPTYPEDSCSKYICDPIILNVNPSIVKNIAGNNFTVIGYHFDAVDFIIYDPSKKEYPVKLIKSVAQKYLLELPQISFNGTQLPVTLSVVPYNKERISSTFNFLLFHPHQVVIKKEVVDSKLYINQVSVVQITASQLLPDVKPICAFTISTLTYKVILYSDVYFVDKNSQSLYCIVSWKESASITIDILWSRVWNYFGGDDSALIQQHIVSFNTTKIPLRTYQYAPTLLASYLYDKAYTIAVLFSDIFEIFIESGSSYTVYTNSVPCSFVFENKTDALISIDLEDCMIKTCGRVMTLKFKTPFLQKNAKNIIKPESTLKVLDKRIRYANARYSDSISSDVLIGPYLDNLNISMNVNVPNLIGLCDNLIIDFKGTKNFPLVGMNATLSYLKNSYIDLQSINQELSTQSAFIVSGATTKIILGSQFLYQGLPSGSYNLKISMRDILNQYAEQVYILQRNESLIDPWSSLVLVGASEPLVTYTANSVWFSQLLKVPEKCSVPTSNITYSWNILGNTTNNIKSNFSVFSIPAFSLFPKSNYKISANLSYGNSSISKEFIIQTVSDSISVNIPSTLTFGQKQNVILIPNIYDSHYSPKSQPNFECQWSCNTVSNTPCPLKISLNVCNLTFANTLPNGKYSFNVFVTNPLTGTTANSWAVSVKIVSGSYPVARLKPSKAYTFASDSGFSIQAIVDLQSVSSKSQLLYSWYTTSKCSSGSTGTVIDLSSDQVTSVLPVRDILKIKPNVLIPGVIYCFLLDLSDPGYENSLNTTLETQISVLKLPFGGTCSSSISESNGVISMTEFEDTLKIICSDWISDSNSYPLYYLIEQQKVTSFNDLPKWNNWMQVGLSSTSSTISMVLSSGKYLLRVNITDALGSTSSSPKTYFVSVNPSSNLDSTKIANLIKDSKSSNNIESLLSILSAISSLDFSKLQYISKRETSIQDLLAIQDSALSSYYDLLNENTIILDDQTSKMLSGNIKNLIGTSCNLPNSNSIVAMNTFIKLVSNSNTMSVKYDSKLSWDTVDNFISILDTFSCVLTDSSQNIDLFRTNMNPLLLQIAQSSLINSVCGEISYSVSKSVISPIFGKARQGFYFKKKII